MDLQSRLNEPHRNALSRLPATGPSTELPPAKENLPALVLGLGLNGLGVARSLWAEGIDVHVLDPDRTQPEARSRAIRHVDAIERLSGEPLLNGLERFAERHDAGAVLFPTQELTVRTLIEAAPQRLRRFRYAMPPSRLMTALTSKIGFADLCQRLDAPAPRTIVLRTAADLAQARSLKWPCVLKPADRDPAYDQRFKKAYRLQSFADLEQLYTEIHPIKRDMVVQEWIEGSDGDLYFCLQYRAQERAQASFCGRKIRSWPPSVGGTASCLPAPRAQAELTALTDGFFAALDVEGFVAMEFKRSAADGRFLMVEPTVGRTDYQCEVATLNGVNLPAAAYASAAGETVPAPLGTSVLRIWRDSSADSQSAAMTGDRSLPPGRVVDALFRWNDPAPWLSLKWRAVQHRLKS